IAGTGVLPQRPECPRHAGTEPDPPRLPPLRLADLAAAVAATDVEPAGAEVDVAPAQLDRLPDPQRRLRQEDEEQPPFLRERLEQPRELVLGQRLHLPLIVVSPGGELVDDG